MKRSIRLLAIGLLAVFALAQDKLDFTGTWKLDPLRSRLDSIKASKNLVLKIEHADPKLAITTIGDDGSTTVQLTTDGSAPPGAAANGNASARWDSYEGTRLIWEVERQTPEGPVSITRRAKLVDKGRIMTTVVTIKDKNGERTGYEFFVKE